MSAHNSYSSEKLTSLVKQNFSELTGLDGSADDAPSLTDVEVKKICATQNSSCYLIESSQLTAPVFLKHTAPKSAVEEYRSQQIVSEKNHSKRYRVPKHIACMPEHGFLSMEYIQGESLVALLLNRKSPDDAKIAAIEESAKWLANYHSLEQVGESRVDSQERLNYLRECLEPVWANLQQDAKLLHCYEWLQNHAKNVADVSLPDGIVHGDWKSENVIIASDGIIGIDFLAERHGPQITDLTQYVLHLLFHKMRLGSLGSWHHIDSWVSTFITAYRNSGQPAPALVLKWMCVLHLLRFWAAEQSRKSPYGKIQALVMRRTTIAFTKNFSVD